MMKSDGKGIGKNKSFPIFYNALLAGITIILMLLFYYGKIENTPIKIIAALFVPLAGFVINIFILVGWRWLS